MSKFDRNIFYGGYDSFAVSKEKYSKEEAINIAKKEFNGIGYKFLAIGSGWVKHRAGVNEDDEPVVGWWLEYKDTGRNCPAFIFHGTNNNEEKFCEDYEYVLLGGGRQ